MKFLIKYPSRERPNIFLEQISEYIRLASGKHEFNWIFTFDKDDATMNNQRIYAAVKSLTGDRFVIGLQDGGGKIAACNAHVNDNLRDSEILLLVSDDMIPQNHDWDDHIAKFLTRSYPDLDGAVHVNDGLQGQRLCTLSCMGRKFYDRFGYFYHPDYKSCYCDNEYTLIAWGSRRMVWCPDVLIRHHWVGNDLQDELHHSNHALMARDQKVFEARRSRGFPMGSILVKP